MSVVTVVEVFVLFGVGWCCFCFGNGVRCTQFLLLMVLVSVFTSYKWAFSAAITTRYPGAGGPWCKLLFRNLLGLKEGLCACCWKRTAGALAYLIVHFAHSGCRSDHLGSSWVWNVFVHFFRFAFPLAAWGKVLACWWRWSVSEQPFSRVLFFFKMFLAVQTLCLTSLFSWGKILEY